MPHVKVIIKEKEDTKSIVQELNLVSPIQQVELSHFIILEAGMKSGKTSVMFHFKLANGTSVIAETSAAIFNGMASAVKGAVIRFEEKS